jgi:hypothetical protein
MCKDQQMKLTASNCKNNENFGYQLSISDNVLVVGGLNGEAAYVFEKNAHNSWTQTAKLTADDGASGDSFGHSVGIDGNIIIVGAALHNTTGAAYIYSRQDAGNWTQAAKITASDGAEGNKFGYTVAASEDLVVVGLAGSSDAVYIFEKDSVSGIWEETRKLLTHKYQRDLSISGNVLAVGTANYEVDSSSVRSVVVYKKNETDGSWARTMNITSPTSSTIDNDLFGVRVSVDDYVMIAAYVYKKNQTTWELTAILTTDAGSTGHYFGWSVGVADSTIVVSAYGDDSGRGSVYTFQNNAGNWTQMNNITADDGKSTDFFGYSFDIDGDIVAVGAYGDDYFKGSVYLNKLLT